MDLTVDDVQLESAGATSSYLSSPFPISPVDLRGTHGAEGLHGAAEPPTGKVFALGKYDYSGGDP